MEGGHLALRLLRNLPEEEPVEAVVRSELGVEGGRQEAALASGYGGAIWKAGQHLDHGTDVLDDGGSNEDGPVRRISQRGDMELGLEAVHLAAEGIPPDANVHGLQGRDAAGV